MVEAQDNLDTPPGSPPGILTLHGNIDCYNVEEILQSGLQQLETVDSLEVSLAGIDNADSSVLALLIEWYRQAQAQNKSIRFKDAPAFISAIMNLTELQDILPLELS